jgi:hypothetical protein
MINKGQYTVFTFANKSTNIICNILNIKKPIVNLNGIVCIIIIVINRNIRWNESREEKLHRPKAESRLKIKGEKKEEAGVQTAAT